MKEQKVRKFNLGSENKVIMGKWVAKNGEFEISIDGNVGVFSQINSGEWFPLLKRGKLSIGSQKLKDITKSGELTWRCMELLRDSFSFYWGTTTSLTLNRTGDILTVSNYIQTYTLSRVHE